VGGQDVIDWLFKSKIALLEVNATIQALKDQTGNSKLYKACQAELTAEISAKTTGEDTQDQDEESKRRAMFEVYLETERTKAEVVGPDWGRPSNGNDFMQEEEQRMLLSQLAGESQKKASKKPIWHKRVLAHTPWSR
jgi:hypothetical protein